jgi:hypothetical protein
MSYIFTAVTFIYMVTGEATNEPITKECTPGEGHVYKYSTISRTTSMIMLRDFPRQIFEGGK